MREVIEPLMPSLWFERILKIANGQLGSVENGLRHAFHLLQLAPVPFKRALTSESDEDGFEALLEAGAFDAAARRLAGDSTAVTVEAVGEGGNYRATINFPNRGCAISGRGDNEASAILNAWTSSILDLRSECGLD